MKFEQAVLNLISEPTFKEKTEDEIAEALTELLSKIDKYD